MDEIYDKRTVIELKALCKERCITGVSKLRKYDIIRKLINYDDLNKSIVKEEKKVKSEYNKKDLYTKDILINQYNIHKKYYIERITTMTKLNIKFRQACIPEDISENIIKFILHKNGDKTCTWNCIGDLSSEIEGIQECKCFTSTGPLSFSPSSDWSVIYFLDATDWLNDNFILYKIPLEKSSDIWKNIMVNKTQTFYQQTLQGRRPRITWTSLYEQIKDYCSIIFKGNFLDI